MKRMRMLGLVVFVATVVSGQEKAVAQTPHFGGRGGTEHGAKQCPDYVIGLHGYVGTGGEGGTVVTQLGFTCANGEHELGTFGPPQGTYFQIECNPGDAAYGVTGRSGKFLDAIGLLCRDPKGNSYVARVTMGPFSGVAGGGGGSPFNSMSCGEQREVRLMGLDVWSGANVDGFEPVCSPKVTKPLDLVSDRMDDNNLLLNPQWQYQIDHQSCGPSGGTNCSYPDVPKMCDVHNDPLLTACTNQNVTLNTQPNMGANVGCNQPWDLPGIGLMAGHKNWFPVTVTGAVVLQSGYDDQLVMQNIVGWDADMDLFVRPFQGRGLTLASAQEKDSQIGVEWDGYEVFFDQKDKPVSLWWDLFFKNRNNDNAKILVNPEHPNAPSSGSNNPKARDNSVVIGMLGLDCRHECHTELHPTYAMAIHTQANRTDDRWSVFARNWGNEGSCGSLQEEVQIQSFSMRLGHPYATSVNINSEYLVGRAGRYDQDITILSPPTVGWNLPLTVVNAGGPDAAAILTISLPPPAARAVVLGELALNWTESLAGTSRATVAAPLMPLRTTTPSRDDVHLQGLMNRMSPEQTKVFLANVPKPKPAVPVTAVAIPQNPHLSPAKVGDFKKIVRSTPDPVQEQQILKFNQAICVAYEGKPPGLAKACSALGPTAITHIGATTISHVAVISVEPLPLQFTPVSGGPQAVTITNISKAQINIGTPSVGGTNATDFTIDSGCLRASLAPGATCKIGVRFKPRGTGQRTAQLDIPLSNGSQGAVVEMTGPGLIP